MGHKRDEDMREELGIDVNAETKKHQKRRSNFSSGCLRLLHQYKPTKDERNSGQNPIGTSNDLWL
jgi:hypothetical protein